MRALNDIHLTRRRVLWLLTAVGGVAGVAGIARVGPFRGRESGPLGAVFDRHDSALRIGEAYLRNDPQDADVESLPASIAGSPEEAVRIFETMRPSELTDWIRERVRDDFRDGRMVVLDGWVLSRTVVRLCALLALTDRPGPINGDRLAD